MIRGETRKQAHMKSLPLETQASIKKSLEAPSPKPRGMISTISMKFSKSQGEALMKQGSLLKMATLARETSIGISNEPPPPGGTIKAVTLPGAIDQTLAWNPGVKP